MECQASDSKKLFKVFDASKRKRTRKKREGLDDSNSLATDESNSGCHQQTVRQVSSAKVSLRDIPTSHTIAAASDHDCKRERDRESSPSGSRSPARRDYRTGRSPRRHRRTTKDCVSLALKAGLVSTPRSNTPEQAANEGVGSIPQDQDSFIYAFLEEAIKRDQKRTRHSRRYEDHERDTSTKREHHRHHHRRRHEECSHDRERTRERSKKDGAASIVDQTVLFETFAKLCAQLNEKTTTSNPPVQRTLSHKSLQCEVVKRRDGYDIDQHPVRLQNLEEHSRENVSKIRSHENFRDKTYSHDKIRPSPSRMQKQDKCMCCYDKDINASKINVNRMRNVADDRYSGYPPDPVPPRNNLDQIYSRSRVADNREYRDYDRDYSRHYDERRKCFEQKASRSFDVNRDYPEDDSYRRTARSDNMKAKYYGEKDKYYEDKDLDTRDRYKKDRRSRRNSDRFDGNSVASREEDYRDRDRDRDRYSERERDSGLSVADCDTSTISEKSNYLRVVKQEIAEQRDAMDKMMKLWKELMRCFKGLSAQGQAQNNKSVHESAANAQESAAAQLQLWRECMHRYETVARDVGDTDARLMEEINKQRSEMAEMASMWQECLQRYREMSTDFNSLKQQVTSTKPPPFIPPENPTRLPAAPMTCAEGEGSIPPAPYRLPNNFPPMPPMPSGYPSGGSPLRTRASAPPAWWWCGEGGPRESPRRRSSPDSRGSRDRDRRHRHKDRDRDDSRYKEKSSKPNAARSEHRHRKR